MPYKNIVLLSTTLDLECIILKSSFHICALYPSSLLASLRKFAVHGLTIVKLIISLIFSAKLNLSPP